MTRTGSERTQLAFVLNALSREWRKVMLGSIRDFDVDVRDYTTLAFVNQRPNSSNADLSRRLGVSPQSVHIALGSLERRKLIARRPSPDHGRVVHYQITASGQQLLRACDKIAEEVNDHVFCAFDKEARMAFLHAGIDSLRKLREEASDRSTGPRRLGDARPAK
ncbi:MAG: MarR family winged helix-turn-helix transcriptional regulator [Acidimicrobiales bacterium]